MAETPVVNLGDKPEPTYELYIGRAVPSRGLKRSKWANPFKEGDRAEVIAEYEEHLLSSPELMAALPELRGKVLACWCAPEPCHGDVLVRLANEGPPAMRRR
jgi:Domain of unknown function (DUF4326)